MNSATSEESASASEELSSQAEVMNQQVNRFRLRAGGHSASYRGLEELNPDVLRMLKRLPEQNKF